MRFSSERGFTFIEVLVAIFLLSLVTVVIVQIYNSGLFSIMVSGNRTEALYELQQELEMATLTASPSGNIETFKITINGEDYDIHGDKIYREVFVEGKPVSATVVVAIPTDDILAHGHTPGGGHHAL